MPKPAQDAVFLTGFWPDYETLFLQDVKLAEREVVLLNPLQPYANSKFHKHLPRPIRNALYFSILKKQFHSHPKATFIFQDHRLILNAILKYGAPTHSGVILRNICDPNSKTGKAILELRDRSVRIFSFDQTDCEQYGFTFYHQFIKAVQHQITATPGYDFSFIGKNKGRDKTLNQIQAQAAAAGYRMRINYIGSAPEDHFRKQIPYTQYLDLQLDCHCIVDITQQGQQGLTLRPLEAAVYGRKLLSNNPSLKKHALFHPNNIMIIKDGIRSQALADFMEKPLQPISSNVIQQHQPDTVFQNIVKNIEVQ